MSSIFDVGSCLHDALFGSKSDTTTTTTTGTSTADVSLDRPPAITGEPMVGKQITMSQGTWRENTLRDQSPRLAQVVNDLSADNVILREHLEALTDLLRPFADCPIANIETEGLTDDGTPPPDPDDMVITRGITVGDLQRARVYLESLDAVLLNERPVCRI